MSVKVLFFASVKDAVGCAALEVDLDTPATVADLVDVLVARSGERAKIALTAESVRIALNQELQNGPCVINDGDEVGFLPPVTGG
jgi:molybdopterin synthase sulfur carrier subunit